jgi:hypothetical protein
MCLAAIHFHGEQLVLLFFGILGLLLLGLIWFTIWLVRRVKRRRGNTAYWLAPIPLVIVLGAMFIVDRAQSPNYGPPEILSTSKLGRLIKALPDYAPFGYSGLAFYKGKLYVATNLGLLELDEGRISRVFRFQKNDSVISGPWLDTADQLLWALDNHTNQLLNYDGVVWHRVDFPRPQKGYYSRGDVLEGPKPIGNANGFWLQSGGSVWRWDPIKNNWSFEPQRSSNLNSQDAGEIIGVVPLGTKLFFIVRHELLSFLVKESQDFASDSLVTSDGGWRTVPNKSGRNFFADSWIVADDGGYIRTRDGLLLKVTPESIARVETPGVCESLAVQSGTLLASFRSDGIYEYTGAWRRLADNPYTSGEGEYWAFLSSNVKELAFATNGKPVVDREHSSGRDMKFTRNAPTALWFFQGTGFQHIDIP